MPPSEEDHDQRFKLLLREYPREFFEMFFPDWAPRFAFDQVEWLDKELYLDPPQGDIRGPDRKRSPGRLTFFLIEMDRKPVEVRESLLVLRLATSQPEPSAKPSSCTIFRENEKLQKLGLKESLFPRGTQESRN